MNQRAFKCVDCGFVFHNWTTISQCIVCHGYVEEVAYELKPVQSKRTLTDFDVGSKYKSFEIVKIDNNTVVIQSQTIPNGTTNGYKVRLMFDFETVTEFEYMEDRDNEPKLHLTFSPAKMEIVEVVRDK